MAPDKSRSTPHAKGSRTNANGKSPIMIMKAKLRAAELKIEVCEAGRVQADKNLEEAERKTQRAEKNVHHLQDENEGLRAQLQQLRKKPPMIVPRSWT